MRIECIVNGERRRLDGVWEGESLLYVLRERMGLPGSKNACEQGECGSCSVYLDDELVCSCLVLAGQADGAEVVTVEGLARDGTPGPLQQAFMDEQAGQCGYCLSGILASATALLARTPAPTQAQVREALDGHLCRCGAHNRIVRAVSRAARTMAAT